MIRWTRRGILAGALPAAAQDLRFSKRRPAEALLGAWALVSYSRQTASTQPSFPFGPNPVGRIAYDGYGRMSVQIARRERPRFAAGPWQPTPAEMGAAFTSYLAYYGAYEVPDNHTLIHHVAASLIPDWTGGALHGSYEISGKQLILTFPAAEGASDRMVWERTT